MARQSPIDPNNVELGGVKSGQLEIVGDAMNAAIAAIITGGVGPEAIASVGAADAAEEAARGATTLFRSVTSTADQLMRWERLDAIGPARFGTCEQLGQPTIFTMTRTAKIRLHWLVSRPSNHSPLGQRFSLPARFDHQGEDWTHDAWSVVVEVEGVPDDEGNQVGTAWFLVPDAPQDWLSEGKRFTLFEGHLALAEGEIRLVGTG